MTQPEAIERLAKWGAGLTWAKMFYAETLRDMTAALVRILDNKTDVERITENAIRLTHAVVESLTA